MKVFFSFVSIYHGIMFSASGIMTSFVIYLNDTIDEPISSRRSSTAAPILTNQTEEVTSIIQHVLIENKTELNSSLVLNGTESPENETILADDRSAHRLLWGSITILVAIVTVLGNGSLIWIIAKTSQLRTITNSFIVSLATSDLIVGIIIMPVCAGKISTILVAIVTVLQLP